MFDHFVVINVLSLTTSKSRDYLKKANVFPNA